MTEAVSEISAFLHFLLPMYFKINRINGILLPNSKLSSWV